LRDNLTFRRTEGEKCRNEEKKIGKKCENICQKS